MEKEGLVLKGIRGNYSICDKKGNVFLCRGGKSLFQKNSIVVGDKVFFQQNEDAGWITRILPRKNQIIRQKHSKNQILFANLEQVFILDALNCPQTNFILSCVYAFYLENVQAIILLTKEDLAKQKTKKELVKFYQLAKINVLVHNLFDKGVRKKEFLQRLKNKTTLFFGQSGVGKSSLLNYLFPEMHLKTRMVNKNMLGRHTTTRTEIYKKKDNIFIADSPGIREFIFPRSDKKILAKKFFLMKNVAMDCFFKDCLHDTEPKCAVKLAVEKKDYPFELYQHYLQLLKKSN